ncbi:MAG: hypothetical protein RR429_07595 [Hafnia sp.]
MFAYFTQKQPVNSHASGGYALASLIHVMTQSKKNTPLGKKIYQQIMRHQEILPAAYPESYRAECIHGAHSLPSSLVRVARQYYLGDRIDILLDTALSRSFFPLVIPETQRMQGEARILHSTLSLMEHVQRSGHYIASVDNGQHWIAMINQDGQLSIYDPESGKHGQPAFTKGNHLVLANKRYDYAGILIRL